MMENGKTRGKAPPSHPPHMGTWVSGLLGIPGHLQDSSLSPTRAAKTHGSQPRMTGNWMRGLDGRAGHSPGAQASSSNLSLSHLPHPQAARPAHSTGQVLKARHLPRRHAGGPDLSWGVPGLPWGTLISRRSYSAPAQAHRPNGAAARRIQQPDASGAQVS